jgi:type I pantothenate kinase
LDFIDLSIYLDADEANIERWFIDRFQKLIAAAADDPESFYARWTGLEAEQSGELARHVWREINGVNLREHILPTRTRADIIVEKGSDHRVRQVYIRKA